MSQGQIRRWVRREDLRQLTEAEREEIQSISQCGCKQCSRMFSVETGEEVNSASFTEEQLAEIRHAMFFGGSTIRLPGGWIPVDYSCGQETGTFYCSDHAFLGVSSELCASCLDDWMSGVFEYDH